MNPRHLYLTLFLGLVLISCSAAPVGSPTAPSPTPTAQFNASAEDLKAIQQTTLDYVEGWYDGNAERMERSLHLELVKRSIQNNKLVTIGKDEMVKYTQAGAGMRYQGEKKFSVTILDVYNDIAAVRAESPEYIDYLQIGKVNGSWVIINALWAYKQSK